MVKTRSQWRALFVGMFLATALILFNAGFAAASGHAKKTIPLSSAQVMRLVKSASSIQTIPNSLSPPLADAAQDQGTELAQKVYGNVGSNKVSCNPTWTQVQVPVTSCVWGDRNGKLTVVLLGDSHAAQWISAFNLIGKRLHWKIVLLTKSACAVPDTNFYDYSTKGPYPACNQWHSYATKVINKLDPAAVVFASDVVYPLDSSGGHISAETWTAGLAKTLGSISSPSVKKVVLGDEPRLGNPYPGEVGPACLAAHETNVQFCSTPTSIATRAGLYQADESGATQGGAAYIDVTPWFCSTTCTAVVDGITVYADDGHITNEYAAFLSGALQAELEQVTHLS